MQFADDFLLFTHNEENAQKTKDFAEEKLNKLGLEMHPQKTRIAQSNPNLTFLGERLPTLS